MASAVTKLEEYTGDDTPVSLQNREPDARLSLPIETRLVLGVSLASLIGFTLGAIHGSTVASFRFRAENAHRLPKTQTAWYMYHKSKNYNRGLAGISEGAKMTGRLAFWMFLFLGTEEGIDGARVALTGIRKGDDAAQYASRDFASTALAGLGVGGAFSAWNRFPLPTAVRMSKLGLKLGIGYGLLQDLAGVLRGRHLGYVDLIKRHAFGAAVDEAPAAAG